MMLRQAKTIKVYWDSQDPNNEGWAQQVIYDDGHEESGPFDGVHDARDGSELAGAVAEIAWSEGIEISEDEVAAERNRDGGYAIWTRDE